MEKKSDVNVKVYYSNLTKKEKGQFLQYLTTRYHYPSSTMSVKLRQNSRVKLRFDEEENIKHAIKEGLWRQ